MFKPGSLFLTVRVQFNLQVQHLPFFSFLNCRCATDTSCKCSRLALLSPDGNNICFGYNKPPNDYKNPAGTAIILIGRYNSTVYWITHIPLLNVAASNRPFPSQVHTLCTSHVHVRTLNATHCSIHFTLYILRSPT